jgi:hypothetical protein
MRRIGATALALLALGAAAGCGKSEAATGPDPSKGRVARGKYLVEGIGCGDCHTPYKMGPKGPEKDPSMYLAGHPESFKLPPPPAGNDAWNVSIASTVTAFAGPWGISYAMNLTPDVNTGIGIWTEDMFVRAIKEGKHWGQSRPIQPPMPWEYFRNLTDEDLRSIYAYLRTIPPVTNHVPEYQPPPSSDE